MFSSCNRPWKDTLFCLAALTFTFFPWDVQASSERRQLIQGQTIINEDVTNIPISDRWPYTVALGVCTDGTPTSVICGATLIHPYVVLTAGRLYSVFLGLHMSKKC
jgi:V8-like Glu-specific endopeptidase